MTEISETTDIERIQKLAEKCYMDAYKNIHTEEQNRFSFNEMYSSSSLEYQIKDLKSRFLFSTVMASIWHIFQCIQLQKANGCLTNFMFYPIAKGLAMAGH